MREKVYCAECKHSRMIFTYHCHHPKNMTESTESRGLTPKWKADYLNRNNRCRRWEQRHPGDEI